MRAAPAVEAALDDALALRRCFVLAYGLTGCALGVWIGQRLQWPLAIVVPALTVFAAGCGLLLARRLLRPGRAGRLRWDGMVWLDDSGPCTLQLMIDLGDWRLLRLHSVPLPGQEAHRRSPARWALATAKAAGAEWPALAVALRASRQSGPAGVHHASGALPPS